MSSPKQLQKWAIRFFCWIMATKCPIQMGPDCVAWRCCRADCIAKSGQLTFTLQPQAAGVNEWMGEMCCLFIYSKHCSRHTAQLSCSEYWPGDSRLAPV